MNIKDCFVGKKVKYIVQEPPEYKRYEYVGTVTAVYEDHAIIDCPEVSDHLWLDDDTSDLFIDA